MRLIFGDDNKEKRQYKNMKTKYKNEKNMKIKSPAGVKVKTEGGERARWRGGRSGFLIKPQSSLTSISFFCLSLEDN